MSAELWALVGVGLGALLAGGANLLLAWRQETLEARAGVDVVAGILKRAEYSIRKRLPETPMDDPEVQWWAPGEVPDPGAWRVYQRAAVSRLPRKTVVAIEAAMARLGELNTLSALVQSRHTEARSRLSDLLGLPPAEDEKTDEAAAAILDALAEDAARYFSLAISPEDQKTLRSTADQFQAVRQGLGDSSPAWVADDEELLRLASEDAKRDVGVKDGEALGHEQRRALLDAVARNRDPQGRRDIFRALHWRAVFPAITVVVLIFTVVAWAVSSETARERAEQAEQTVANLVGGENVVDCEPVIDRESHFDCVTSRPPAVQGGSTQAPRQTAATLYARSGDGTRRAAVEKVRRFFVVNGEGQKRQLITEMVPSKDEPTPGNLATADADDLTPVHTWSVAE